MTQEEKWLLLQLILQDIRGNWSDTEDRLNAAMDLASELNATDFINSINLYKERCEDGDNDGRFFRDCTEGSYVGLESIHGLKPTICDKSDEFKLEAMVITYPDCQFDDWEQYQKELQNV